MGAGACRIVAMIANDAGRSRDVHASRAWTTHITKPIRVEQLVQALYLVPGRGGDNG